MNRIYWDIDKISMLTDHLNASTHKHGMIQFFLSLDGELEIKVGKEKIQCSCIIVNKNVNHSFKANNKPHFTCVIEPVSIFGVKVNELLQNKDYIILDDSKVSILANSASTMVTAFNIEAYKAFMIEMHGCLGVSYQNNKFDERILDFLKMLEHCTCDDHSIDEYAGNLYLSSSRFSHLFKEQVGITLKSYLTLHQLERAFQNLLSGKRITESALNAGFDSSSHFASTVKRLMGLPARNAIKDSEFLKVY